MLQEPACPSCGSGDASVIGIEEGKIRYHCTLCLEDWLDGGGPDLKLCDSPDCRNWIPEGIAYCSHCVTRGAPA